MADEYVLHCVKAINELGAAAGSQIVYTPDDHRSHIQVVRHMPSGMEDVLLKHFGHLQLVLPTGHERQILKRLYQALQIRETA